MNYFSSGQIYTNVTSLILKLFQDYKKNPAFSTNLKTDCVPSPVDGCWSGFQIVMAGRVHEGAETWAGGHKHKRTSGPTAQRLKAAIWWWSVGVQRSRVVASGGVAVKRSRGRSGGGIVVCPLQEVHSGYPSRPPALFGVHVTEGGTRWRRET